MSSDKKKKQVETEIKKFIDNANDKIKEIYGYKPYGKVVLDLLVEIAAQDHIFEKEEKKKKRSS